MWLGNFPEDYTTVPCLFTTHQASGAPVEPSSNFEAADVAIFKDGSATEKTTANGLTMTSTFNGMTGLHRLLIDLSNDTGDAGFWTANAIYTIVLSPDETINGVTAIKVIGQFGIALGGIALDAAGVRAAVGLASANLDSQIGDLPTNAELATSLASADDATLAAIAALNDLSAAEVNAEVDAALADYDGPTHAELTSGLAAADDAVLAQVALVKTATDKLEDTLELDGSLYRFTEAALAEGPTGGSAPTVSAIADEVQTRTIAAVTTVNGLAANSVTAAALAGDAGTEIGTAVWATGTRVLTANTNLSIPDAAAIRSAVGLASANLDTQIDALPTNAELATALGTADDAVLTQVSLVKAKTDQLIFTVANQLDVNVQYVNDVELAGSGVEDTDEWRPA